MKILSFLNVTNLQRISCDSGYIFQRLIASQLIEAGHSFVFVSPVTIEGLAEPHFRHIPFLFGRHKFEVRFSFPWPEIERILSEEVPDIIWVNQCELATSFRAVLCSLGGNTPIVSYLHYFPYEMSADEQTINADPAINFNGDGELLVLKFLSGVIASDIVLVHSNHASRLLQAGLRAFSLTTKARIEIVPPPFDPALLPTSSTSFKNRNLLLYNHRLYTQYGTE